MNVGCSVSSLRGLFALSSISDTKLSRPPAAVRTTAAAGTERCGDTCYTPQATAIFGYPIHFLPSYLDPSSICPLVTLSPFILFPVTLSPIFLFCNDVIFR
jgi:hypothetical protein